MRIAVVGSGVSGLAATWALNEHSAHEVNLYESGDYVGGHAHTVEFEREGKESVDVDSGFIVFNPPTYPNFLAFCKHKAVPLNPTSMTFAVSRDMGKFEWAGKDAGTVFVQWQNLFNPRVYRMIFDIIRFNLFGLDLVSSPSLATRSSSTDSKASGAHPSGTGQTKKGLDAHEVNEEMSIGEYLDREGFGEGFKEDYLLPMTAAIWSTPADKCALDFPARTLIRFFHNHHLMQVDGRPKWLTIKGGSKNYVEKITQSMRPENIHLNTKIVAITPHDGGVTLVEDNGKRHEYDHVILATHSDTALELLKAGGGPTKEEQDVLSAFEWSKNEAVLHWDEKFMPVHKRAWSAWNYITSTENDSGSPSTSASAVNTVSLTYDMNQLQHISPEESGPVLVTLNPPFEVDPKKVVGRYQYEHPMYSAASVKAQGQLPTIQNKRNVTFAGAWTNYGFHEDGFTSGLKIAVETFGAKIPFPIRPANRDIEERPVARALVANSEHIRRWAASTEIWRWIVWAVVTAFLFLAQGLQAAGLQSAARQVDGLRTFWVEKKGSSFPMKSLAQKKRQ